MRRKFDEIVNSEVDFADGDEVNEFDDIFKTMSDGKDSIEYIENNSMDRINIERMSDQTTNEKVNDIF